MDPNPSYTYHTAEESVQGHATIMTAFFEDFDATMANWQG